MSDIICRIVAGEIPCAKVYENEDIIAFKDINPMAPIHILVTPKAHVLADASEVTPDNSAIIAKCFEAIAVIAEQLGLKSGFRVINNCGPDGGQTIPHLHFHLLAGENLPEKLV